MKREIVSLLLVFQILNAVVEFKGHAKTLPCSETEVACLCGSPEQKEGIQKFEVRYDLMNLENRENCSMLYDNICKYHSCLYHPVKETNGTEIIKSRRDLMIQEEYPKTFVIPPLDDAEGFQQTKTRYRRFPTNCKNAIKPRAYTTFYCTYWPDYMSCDAVCSHGYLMEEGGKAVNKTVRTCMENTMEWLPDEQYPLCKPYINCNPKLISPGKLECKISGSHFTGCYISCHAYEGHNATKKRHYDCLDESFAENLPHCAVPDKNIQLIKKPENFPKVVFVDDF